MVIDAPRATAGKTTVAPPTEALPLARPIAPVVASSDVGPGLTSGEADATALGDGAELDGARVGTGVVVDPQPATRSSTSRVSARRLIDLMQAPPQSVLVHGHATPVSGRGTASRVSRVANDLDDRSVNVHSGTSGDGLVWSVGDSSRVGERAQIRQYTPPMSIPVASTRGHVNSASAGGSRFALVSACSAGRPCSSSPGGPSRTQLGATSAWLSTATRWRGQDLLE